MRAWAVLMVAAVLAGCASPAPPEPPADASGTTLAWRSHAAAPTPRTEVAAAALDTRLVALGGFVADGTNVGTLEVFDPATEAWSVGPSFPLPIHHTALVVHDGAIYAFGGFTGEAFVPTAGVFRWAPGDAAWAPVALLPVPRAAHAAALVGDRVVLAGGFTLGNALLPQVDVYDTAAGAWSRGPDLPVPRDHLGAAAVADLVYAVGGEEGGHDANVAAVHRWDPADPTAPWVEVAPLPRPRGSLAVAVLEERILAVGGQDLERTFDDVDAYDAVRNAWVPLPPLPTARHGFGLAAWGGRAYALLGGPEPGLSVTGAVESLGPGEM